MAEPAEAAKPRIILHLGSNNWQRQGEFAPGSGILHAAHHAAMAARDDLRVYSTFPSPRQTSDRADLSIFAIPHDIPICESISPVSRNRWHGFSDSGFAEYRAALMEHLRRFCDRIRATEGRDPDLIIAHHAFINALVGADLRDHLAAHAAPGVATPQLACFVHGTALKMFRAEIDGHPDYPERFYPMMRASGLFAADGARRADAVVTISTAQAQAFARLFPSYPADRILQSPNGYDPAVFHPAAAGGASRAEVLGQLQARDRDKQPVAPVTMPDGTERLVIFCGKFAAWKRLDAYLAALAQAGMEDVMALVIGDGPPEDWRRYHDLAADLGLERLAFVGPLPQEALARVNAVADLGVYPARREPFGLVLIEAMACGLPVLGARSGGPVDFVDAAVGGLVPEAEGSAFVTSLAAHMRMALVQDWRRTKGPQAAERAARCHTVAAQVDRMLDGLDAVRRADQGNVGGARDAVPLVDASPLSGCA
ncbi:glycosyltransferase [Oceanomicrobium pacificus]|uniref:Glycosyltransferase n=1 Tax=Oceanomicrobium pacificus TaxID=2692916 RepID=A0A6B0TU91_9RHOB|nr:glycosyltransferase [Oceanomicrobium pacificus]MXU66349.1 glycosyltransferase [Oceanomicrobium pacificus]